MFKGKDNITIIFFVTHLFIYYSLQIFLHTNTASISDRKRSYYIIQWL